MKNKRLFVSANIFKRLDNRENTNIIFFTEKELEKMFGNNIHKLSNIIPIILETSSDKITITKI